VNTVLLELQREKLFYLDLLIFDMDCTARRVDQRTYGVYNGRSINFALVAMTSSGWRKCIRVSVLILIFLS